MKVLPLLFLIRRSTQLYTDFFASCARECKVVDLPIDIKIEGDNVELIGIGEHLSADKTGMAFLDIFIADIVGVRLALLVYICFANR